MTGGRANFTAKACSNCRRKKRKCDGETPCSNCRSRTETCNYSTTTWTSKDNLRSEIKELRRDKERADIILDALRQPSHSGFVLEQLQRGDSVAEVEQRILSLTREEDDEDGLEDGDEDDDEDENDEDDDNINEQDTVMMQSPPILTNPLLSTSPAITTSLDLQHHYTMLPGATAGLPLMSSTVQPVPLFDSTPEPYAPPSASIASPNPLAPLIPRTFHAQQTPNFSPPRPGQPPFSPAMMEYHLDLLLLWECPPLTMLDIPAFLSDFLSGRGRYCSLALIYAVVAVTSRFSDAAVAAGAQQQSAAAASPMPGQLYLERGAKLLADASRCETLPDVQALGLLALGEVCNGNEVAARVLAERCLRDSAALCRQCVAMPETAEGREYSARAADTYAGAFSLKSMLELGIGSQAGTVQIAWTATAPGPLETYARPPGMRAKLTGDFVVELAGIVGQPVLRRAPTDPGVVLPVYEKCLEWYKAALGILNVAAATCTPSSLFLHMFYHYSLTVLFRPLSTSQSPIVSGTGGALSPRIVCTQSAQAVFSLAYSFKRLFTLRRTPAFLPFFVYTAGLVLVENRRRETQGAGEMGDAKAGLDGALELLGEMARMHPAAAEALADLRRLG